MKDVVCVMVDEVHKAKADVLRNLLGGVFANVSYVGDLQEL